MRWVAFGTYDVGRHPRVGVLIEGLRAAGDEVVEVNAPLDLDTAARVQLLRQPWRIPITALRLSRCWVRLAVRSRGTHPDAVLVGYLGHLDVRLARLLFRRTPIALDHLVFLAGTAGDRGLASSGGRKERALAAVDRAALRTADVVVVDTEEHAAAVADTTGQQAVVVPVGAERDWFLARRCPDANSGGGTGDDGGPLRVIFFGLFTALQGTVTVGHALAELADRPDVAVTMVGQGQEYDECRRAAAPNSRVDWRGWVPRASLPELVASHDVCLGIFGTTEKAQNVVPTKVYQGAAAGCAIVTSDTAPQRRLLDDPSTDIAAVFVPAGDPSALADALAALASDRDALRSLRGRAGARADAAFRSLAVIAPLRNRVVYLLHSDRRSDKTIKGPALALTNSPHADSAGKTAGQPVPDAPLAPRAALRWDVVRRMAAGVAPGTILEIGCGMGAMGMRLARTAAYTAVEPDDKSFAVAQARISPLGGTVLHGDHTSIPAGQQYDLVCAFEVLEHINDDAEALANWLPLVKPGGHLLLSVPADPDKFGPWDTLVGHYRRYDADQLATRMTGAGAEVVTVTHYAWPLGYIMESVRNVIAGRRKLDEGETPEDRSSGSGRALQPTKVLAGKAIQLAVVPWAWLQRLQTRRGPGLVALAVRPG